MSDILFCINAVMPVFVIMAVGFISRVCGLINDDVVEKMNRVVFNIFVPTTLFYNIYGTEMGSVVKPFLIMYSSLGVVGAFVFSLLYTRIIAKDIRQRGVMMQGLFRSNFVVIGLPIVSALFADCDLSAVALLVAVVVTIFNILAVFSLTYYGGQRSSLRKTIVEILRNPVIIGALAGLLSVACSIKLPTFIEMSLAQMSNAVSAIMLFLLGAFFRFDTMRSHLGSVLLVCAGRLLFIPAVFLPLGYLFGFRGIEFSALIALFASSTATTSFTVAQQMGGDSRLAGDIVVLTSALCPFTMLLWCFLFKRLGAV